MAQQDLSYKRIFRTWWPLATSWLFMAFELPSIVSFVARMPEAETSLAAFGGVTFALALIIESPIIMLLPASTTLCTNYQRFCVVRRMTHLMSGALTLIHILIVTTPLFDLVVDKLLGVPKELHELVHASFLVMIPWTWAIAYRRFQQGILILAGRSGDIGVGTVIRFIATFSTLAIGYYTYFTNGAVIAALSLIAGVVAEAVFIGIRVQGEIRILKDKNLPGEDLTPKSFFKFYSPLALSTVLFLLTPPLGSAGMSRMPHTISSLAVWPAVNGLLFLSRSFGIALTEVVIAFLPLPGAPKKLFRMSVFVGIFSSGLLLILSSNIVSRVLLGEIFFLSPELRDLAASALFLAIPAPFLGSLLSLYQGHFTRRHKTRVITESVVLYLVGFSLVVLSGIYYPWASGVEIVISAVAVAMGIQLGWLIFCEKRSEDEPINP